MTTVPKNLNPEKQPPQLPKPSIEEITKLVWAIVALIETIQHFHS